MPHPRLSLFLSLLLATPLAAVGPDNIDVRVADVVKTAGLGKTVVGLYAVDLDSGNVLVRSGQDEPMMPASNLKLVTTAAALATLGPDFNFETKLILINPPKEGAAAQTDAVLLVKGDGDPAFGDDAILRQHGNQVGDVEALIQLWVDAVKKASIKKVSRIVIDDSVFDTTFVHPTWPADQLNRWYCAQVAGLNFYTNCLDVYPVPSATPHDSPFVRVLPEAPFVPTTNIATTGTGDTFWISRKIGTNELTFRGSVKNKRVQPVNVTIHDPPIFFGRLLADRLSKAGITVGEVSRPTPQDVFGQGKGLHTIRTPLNLVLARCNKNSQNLYAESLFKRIGFKATGAPGSFENGAAAVRIFLQKQIGTAAANVRTADGSGLSRDNRVTAHIMVDVLAAMHKDAKLYKAYRQSLSIAGTDGTLDDRMKNIKGRVYGKSGYISGVSCLSGYYIAPSPKPAANKGAAPDPASDADDGHVIAFSFLFNEVRPGLDVVLRLQDNLVRVLDEAYAPAK
jgi:D-alanyl-D-alanine carboxypeptidase/D-alanyl-D-alanine-endopeptidase (penicillin-binding protein 4)